MSPNFSKIITATFLITGTSIGGGMLGLPVMTGRHGFIPAMVMMLISGTMMLLSGLLYVELSVATPDEESSERLTQRYLGGFGHRLFQAVFLFMSFASLMAYTDGGGIHIFHLLQNFKTSLSQLPQGVYGLSFVVLLLLTGTLNDKGLHRLNNILTIGLISSYIILLTLGAGQVDLSNLSYFKTTELLEPLPIFLTSFSCQAFIVPSLAHFLNRDVAALKTSLISGYILSFVIYGLWEMLVLGIVPLEGPEGLIAAYEQGRPVTEFLQHALSTPWTSAITEFFSFFALTTSFLGIFYGLTHFIKELIPPKWGAATPQTRSTLISTLIVIPIVLINFYGKGVFLKAMDLTGSLGDTLINGILPILMIWHLRYSNKGNSKDHTYRLFGGIPLLAIMAIFYITVGLSFFVKHKLIP